MLKETKNGNRNEAKCGHKLQIMPTERAGEAGWWGKEAADGGQQQKLSKNST